MLGEKDRERPGDQTGALPDHNAAKDGAYGSPHPTTQVRPVTWIKLDDKCPRHPKVAALTDRAFRWWVHTLCYASEFRTDGLIPASFLRTVPAKVRAELVTAGLWFVSADEAMQIHDYLEHQRSRAEIDGERERGRNRRTSGGHPADVQRTSSGNPRPEGEAEKETDTDPPSKNEGGAHPRRGLIVSPAAFDRQHGRHVGGFCDWVCFPEAVFDDFVRRVSGSGVSEDRARGSVRSWAHGVRQSWQARGDVPGDDIFAFWRNEWQATHGSNRPAPTGTDPLAGVKAVLGG